MHIVAKITHAVHGDAYIWTLGNYNYTVGPEHTDFYKFDGYTLEDVWAYLLNQGWENVPNAMLPEFRGQR